MVHGYVTAIHPPDGFDVDGEHVTITGETRFGPIGAKNPIGNSPMRDAVQIGAWVEVSGERDRKAKTVTAKTVLIRDDLDRKLTALAVIEKVISTAPELVIAADGYRIRISRTTEVKFPRDLQSAADVHAGLWVLYEGKLGQDGLLVADKARFFSTAHEKAKSKTPQDSSTAQAAAPQPPANGAPAATGNIQAPNNASGQAEEMVDDHRTEIDLDNSIYKISRDETLKSRIRRVGMRLVPVYQKQLPAEDPAKIQFDFVVVDSPEQVEYTSSGLDGLILLASQRVARMRNDDQLAALLADGIALNLQRDQPVFIQVNRANLEEAAILAAGSFVPYAGLVPGSVYGHEREKKLKEQRWRVALQLMADAGYDPWQAPEAWRLAEPRKLPADTSTLKYPEIGGYQFSILNRAYRKPASSPAASESVTDSGASGKQ